MAMELWLLTRLCSYVGRDSQWEKENLSRQEDEIRPLIWIAAAIIVAAAGYYILATGGVLIPAALGFGGVEAIILISSVGILVVAGLLAGAIALRANVAKRRSIDEPRR